MAWRLSLYGWLLLLVLPAMTTFTPAPHWDASPATTFLATLWAFSLLWIALGVRLFFFVTYPFALFGLFVLAADFLRNANLLELVMLAGGFEWHEAFGTLRPYFIAMAVGTIALAVPVYQAIRRSRDGAGQGLASRRRWMAAAALVGMGALLLLSAPATFLRAWPINVVSLAVARAVGHGELIATALPWAPVNPRSSTASWDARRAIAPPAAAETYVLVIGESVRADRLQACGNSRPIALAADAIVYCDVMAASSSTHTAVPLLVSREMPGRSIRVSSDATFLKAFEQAGFRTFWLSLQSPTVAWPDANVVRYFPIRGTDRDDLVPPLEEALADPAPRKMIVLHAYNAHFPYCDRYRPADAKFRVDCAAIGPLPTFENRRPWMDTYDNAMVESMAFNDAVIAALGKLPGEAFFAYVSDHGENVADDERGLVAHALKQPTLYDIRVPMIFWANPAWRARNATRWSSLEAHAKTPAMQADLVPTLLGAAAITYTDKRSDVADLGVRAPPKRTRWALERLGVRIDGDTVR